MGLKLYLSTVSTSLSPQAGSRHEIELGLERISLGRAQGSDVLLPDLSVSSRHATLELRNSETRGQHYTLTDHGSTNGTTLNGEKLPEETSRAVGEGDVIGLGLFFITVIKITPHASDVAPIQTHTLAKKLLKEFQQKQEPLQKIQVLTGPDQGKRFVLPEAFARVTVGREEPCHLVLSDPDVSRQHMELVVEEHFVRAMDLGSKNGTLINKGKFNPLTLTASSPLGHELRDGDTITIGQTTLVYEDLLTKRLSQLSLNKDDVAMPKTPPSPKLAEPQPSTPVAVPHTDTIAQQRSVFETLIYVLSAVLVVGSLVGFWLLLR